MSLPGSAAQQPTPLSPLKHSKGNHIAWLCWAGAEIGARIWERKTVQWSGHRHIRFYVKANASPEQDPSPSTSAVRCSTQLPLQWDQLDPLSRQHVCTAQPALVMCHISLSLSMNCFLLLTPLPCLLDSECWLLGSWADI